MTWLKFHRSAKRYGTLPSRTGYRCLKQLSLERHDGRKSSLISRSPLLMSSWAGMWRQYTLSAAPGNAYCFGSSQMSMPTFWKGLSGSADGRRGSLAWGGCFSSQCRQLATRNFMSFPIRGHHTDCAARSLPDFATPMWPSWILSRICFLKLKGTTILSPLTTSTEECARPLCSLIWIFTSSLCLASWVALVRVSSLSNWSFSDSSWSSRPKTSLSRIVL